MTYLEAVKTCLTKYVDFTGRAGRSEFWWFFLFQVVVSVVLSIFSEALQGLAGLLLLLPAIAVGTRRLHDIGKSGWFQLLAFVPVVGWLVLLYWFVQPSAAGSNAWGSGPAAPAALDVTKSPGAQ